MVVKNNEKKPKQILKLLHFQKEGGGHTIGMHYASIFMC
jgi:hypothetical protein